MCSAQIYCELKINPEQEIPAEFKDFDSFLCHSLELAAVENDIKIIVIDNLTYLKTRNRSERCFAF
jgi:hypothetical protein